MLPAMASIRLVTRADDIGSFSGVLPASLDAHRRGFIRNASIIVPSAWFEDCARALREVPSLCLGVHLTICCEWRHQRWRTVAAPTRVPSLVDAQGFLHASPITVHDAGIEPDQILRECQAQLDLARAHGLEIAYADTHMRWEWLHGPAGRPRMQDLLQDWCRRNGIRWFRSPQLPELQAAANPRLLLDQIQAASDGTYLLVTHQTLPGTALRLESQSFPPGTPCVEAARSAEHALASDPGLTAELQRRGVSFLRFDQL
jgi:predicted glycoside hydrolase/deacetylase ChbG (UPF0249 family)